MERLKEQISVAQKALETLIIALQEPKSPIARDAAIQRFEYTFEAWWKAAGRYLMRIEGIEKASPKGVVRAFFDSGILDHDDSQLALEMVDDRNLSVHTYNESLAEALFRKLPAYANLLNHWLLQMAEKIA